MTAASELGRNTIQHGRGGEVNVAVISEDSRRGVRLEFTDRGPGIPDLALALTDGYTTGGGLGLGLSGARRLCDEFEIDFPFEQGTRVTVVAGSLSERPRRGRLELHDSSHVSQSRIGVQAMANDLGFNDTVAGKAAIAVTEVGTNLLRHGGGGTIAVRAMSRGDALGIEVLALDSGAGMKDFAASAVDGVSTGGTRGNGLGAMQRQSDEFDVYTNPGAGTVVRMAFWNRTPEPDASVYEVGVIAVPMKGDGQRRRVGRKGPRGWRDIPRGGRVGPRRRGLPRGDAGC